MSWETLLYITVAVLVCTLIVDIWQPRFLKEGFTVSPGDNPFVTGYFPRRGDVSFEEDESGYIQDKRHVMGYADVQGLGVNHDFCRMITPKGADESKMFFACALAGTENLSSTIFKTYTVAQGLKTSRDDYMRDADGDGKTDYCAVIKMPGGTWESQCYRALTTTFDTRTFIDVKPPSDIAEILYFYEGIMFWFRFIDDMKDYSENLQLYTGGDMSMNEADVKVLPSQLRLDQSTTNLDDRIQIIKGIKFNGDNQFIRLGDSPNMSFGKKITLTTMRATCVWVYFEEFTNNAHILDFGNGAGQDNVFIGIIGRGDESVDKGAFLRPDVCTNESVIPDYPSGAQPVPSMTPMELMLSTSANVDDPPCVAVPSPRKLPPLLPPQSTPKAITNGQTATLLYEVWSGKLRLQHIKVQKAIPIKTWTHVCITTASGDGVRPAIKIFINGKEMAEDQNGHLPQTSFTTNNYIGKSNWSRDSSQYENRAELFKGSLFDLRGYSQAVTEDKLKKTLEWGKKRLGLSS